MPALANSRHEAFAQALARGLSISAAYAEAGYKPNRGNAHTLLKQNKCISKRVEGTQAEQLEGQGAYRCRGPTFLGHCLHTCGLSFSNQALMAVFEKRLANVEQQTTS